MKMYLAFALLLIVLDGCQSVEQNSPHLASIIGHFQDSMYINDYFNFRMAVPPGYRVAATINKETYPDLGLIPEKEYNTKKLHLQISKKGIETIDDFAWIAISFERKEMFPQPMNPRNYVLLFESGLKESDPDIADFKLESAEVFDNQQFEVASFRELQNGLMSLRKMYLTEIQGYMIRFELDYSSEDKYSFLMTAMSSLRFK